MRLHVDQLTKMTGTTGTTGLTIKDDWVGLDN